MKRPLSTLSAIIIAVGLFSLGLEIKAGIDNMAFKDRAVSVRGLSERIVDANSVIWPVNYSLTGNDLADLYDQCNKKNEILLSFLTSNGISRGEISINPPAVDDLTTHIYSDNRADFKYKLTSSMTVITTKVDFVRELLNRQGELLVKGIAFNNSYITYDFTKLNDIKPEMIAEATKNARKAADQFAADSNSKIGNIKSAEQGYFSIEDKDDSTPYIKKIRVVTNVVYYLEK
jgi:hypothetical protein